MVNSRLREKVWTNQIEQFTGGIWLNEGTQVPETYSPFMENLDPLAAGGMQKRQPVRRDMVIAGGGVRELFWSPFQAGPMGQWLQADPTNGSKYVVMETSSSSQQLRNYTVGNTTPNWTSSTMSGIPTYYTYASSDAFAGGNWYVHQGNQGPRRVSNAGATTGLTQTFNDNISAPTNGNMPASVVGCQHLAAYYFTGSSLESAVLYPNRLRWSHPGRFEDYRTNDKLDVGDNSAIIGLYSVGETLLIIKESSAWVLTGYDSSTFQLRKIADNTYSPADPGSIRSAGCSQAQHGAFVSINGRGVYHWDGKAWTDISGGLKDGIMDGRVNIMHMSIVGDILYCSSGTGTIPSGGADSTSNKSWEYNIQGKFWTQHNATFRGLAAIRPTTSGAPRAYSVHQYGTTNGYSFSFYRQSVAAGSWCDNWDGSNHEIVCQWRSPWQWADNPARKKRFKKTQFVFNKRPNASASDPATYSLSIFKDWDGIHATKTSTINSSKATDTTDYNTLSGYGHASTGSDFDERDQFSAPGSGYAMQVLVSSASTPFDQWGFDSVVFKYVPRLLK